MIKTTLGQLRIAGILDGISLVILLFIAMPLKYWMDIPMAVTIAGSVHGFIFVSYVLVIFYAQIRLRWNIIWSLLALAVAFIPFGNFFYDWQLKKMETRFQN
ncbi:integral membrane protein [Paenisporosarcina quisquiliarum]|nr:integral membrane protein [Paenisporosarcina quisquiliarum]